MLLCVFIFWSIEANYEPFGIKQGAIVPLAENETASTSFDLGPITSMGTGNYTIVMCTMTGEDTRWIDSFLDEYRVVQYIDRKSRWKEFEPYFHFIVHEYDNAHFPEKIVFLHGHESGWHDPGPSKKETIKHLPWSEELGEGIIFLPPGDGSFLFEVSGSYKPFFAPIWRELFQSEIGPVPKHWRTPCCAQFLVTKEAVQGHPKSFYQRIYDWMIYGEGQYVNDDEDINFELLLKLLFGRCPGASGGRYTNTTTACCKRTNDCEHFLKQDSQADNNKHANKNPNLALALTDR